MGWGGGGVCGVRGAAAYSTLVKNGVQNPGIVREIPWRMCAALENKTKKQTKTWSHITTITRYHLSNY